LTKQNKPLFFLLSVALAIGAIAALSFSCRQKETPLDVFRKNLEIIINEAEEQKLDRFKGILHPDFIDQEGRDAEKILVWLIGKLKGHRDVVINLLEIEELITPTNQSDGSVRLDLVVSSGSLKMVRKLIGFYGRLIRLQLRVAEGDPWRITHAEWVEINLADLGAQALEAFNKLFPSQGGVGKVMTESN